MESFEFEFRDIKMAITSDDIYKCLLTITIGLCYCASTYAITKVKCESIRAGSEPDNDDVDSSIFPPINM